MIINFRCRFSAEKTHSNNSLFQAIELQATNMSRNLLKVFYSDSSVWILAGCQI